MPISRHSQLVLWRVLCAAVAAAAAAPQLAGAAEPWKKYQLAPGPDRTQLAQVWTVLAPSESPPPTPWNPPPARTLPVRLEGKGASVMFDWGKETGGFLSLQIGRTSDTQQMASLAFSESSLYWIAGDDSNGGSGHDGPLPVGPLVANKTFSPGAQYLRGGFRYLHVVLQTEGWIEIASAPIVTFTATPNMADPSAWANHFYSSDDLLNRVWYGCGYTVQMCSIDPRHGRTWPPPPNLWNNSATCGTGESVLVDGAKRDRIIWPGDMGISTLTAIATTGDLLAMRNSLNTLYQFQQADGMLPYAGPPVDFFGKSDTYHLWALIGTYNLALYDSSRDWLESVWSRFQRGVAASSAKVSSKSGLFSVTEAADWQRHGQGGENSAANMLYYGVLQAASQLAAELGNHTAADRYSALAASLKSRVQALLWDASKGAFWDNTNNHKLWPQDGNSLAIWFNVTSGDQNKRISDYLHSNWGEFGAASPEWDGNIGTFPGSMEVHAHMAAGQVQRAHDLMQLQWGYMLSKNESTHSTFWEGYNADGTFNFKGIYMSNAHGWATGPAAALSQHTVGIRPLNLGGYRYIVAPQFGHLSHCRGSMAFGGQRRVDVTWIVSESTVSMTIDSSTHPASVGRVQLPAAHGRVISGIQVNGVHLGLDATRLGDLYIAIDDARSMLTLEHVTPGRLSLQVELSSNPLAVTGYTAHKR